MKKNKDVLSFIITFIRTKNFYISHQDFQFCHNNLSWIIVLSKNMTIHKELFEYLQNIVKVEIATFFELFKDKW